MEVSRVDESESMQFAQVALAIAQATVPAYGAPLAGQPYTYAHLLAIACLMRYAGWSADEMATRLATDPILCAAFACERPPSATTLDAFSEMLEEPGLDQIITRVVMRLRWTHANPRDDVSHTG